ncbi:MAG: DUF2306 domain-containing protein [Thermonemataceae bacterium]
MLLRLFRSWSGWILVIYAFFCYLMWEITAQYIPWHTDVAFLRIKQAYIHYWYYETAFFIHVYFAMLVLPAGFTQFSSALRQKLPALHRVMGWIYSSVIILLVAPSGFVMGIYANGGVSSQLAFCLLATLWLYYTAMAVVKIRNGEVAAHQRFMWRSFALTLSAITLRAWKYLIVWLFQPRPMDVYRIVAWLGWVLNLVLVELYILHRIQQKKKRALSLHPTKQTTL